MVFVKKNMMIMVVVVAAMVFVYGGKGAEGQSHHVVGDDRGWELASNIASWAAGRTFMVGDFLWFAYSGGLDKDNVVELNSQHDFESCDLSNPIKMYTNGLDKITLEKEGTRYFASANMESCKKGLKLPVEIKPKSTIVIQSPPSSWQGAALAQEPASPSSSSKICGPTLMIIAAIIFYHSGV